MRLMVFTSMEKTYPKVTLKPLFFSHFVKNLSEVGLSYNLILIFVSGSLLCICDLYFCVKNELKKI